MIEIALGNNIITVKYRSSPVSRRFMVTASDQPEPRRDLVLLQRAQIAGHLLNTATQVSDEIPLLRQGGAALAQASAGWLEPARDAPPQPGLRPWHPLLSGGGELCEVSDLCRCVLAQQDQLGRHQVVQTADRCGFGVLGFGMSHRAKIE